LFVIIPAGRRALHSFKDLILLIIKPTRPVAPHAD
jgi:hypothetical protein